MSLKVTIEADTPEELAEVLSLVATNYEGDEDDDRDADNEGDEDDEDDDEDDS